MPVRSFSGETFVAFIDISGFKELMKNDKDALNAIKIFYQAGYDTLNTPNREVEGFFISDCGVLFVREGSKKQKLEKILFAVKSINQIMLENEFMLTTSIAYGSFDYREKIEFTGIEKNPIYGNAYIKAFLDNENGSPKLEPGQCRLLDDAIQGINLNDNTFPLLKRRINSSKHLYYYWNVESENQVADFEKSYTDSYKLKYSGMMDALKKHNNLI